MASSQGVAPEGFELKMRLNPKPGLDGVIREGSPVTVEVDLCGSEVEPGKTAHFLFDFNDDDVAEIAGTGDACVQKHTYRTPPGATEDVILESNVCVTNGDPNVHNGSTYFSCRKVRVGLPRTPAAPAGITCENGAPAGCYPIDGVWFSWAGGLGPHFPLVIYTNDKCQGEPEDVDELEVALACSPDQAEQVCDGDFEGPIDFLNDDVAIVFCGNFDDRVSSLGRLSTVRKPWPR